VFWVAPLAHVRFKGGMSENDTYRSLEQAASRIRQTNLAQLFADNPNRAHQLDFAVGGVRVNFSRQKWDADIVSLLVELAQQRGIANFLQRMQDGEMVNRSENRAAQHMALRAGPGETRKSQGILISDEITQTKARMEQLADDIHAGNLCGAGGQRISHIVHIGIGGSDLGPKLVANVLRQTKALEVEVRFVANIDAAEINTALHELNPASTLVFVVSKSFTTAETLANASIARQWLVQHLGEVAAQQQMYAISAYPDRAETFGVASANVFGFADWVGGRFSVWSAVGLALVVSLGSAAWNQLLMGAAAMDRHVLTTPLANNMPVLSALVSFWNLNFLHMPARAIVPYASKLALLPLWMQQLVMESNGKSVQSDGTPAQFVGAPIIFGDAGTNAQHAFFQALHQGPNPVPVDFIGVIEDGEDNPSQHQTLLANMLAQASALMNGKSAPPDAPHQHFPGDRPSTTILLDELSPFVLGGLLAFYEHETVVLAHLCGLNPFDQWGVELGKELALQIEQQMTEGNPKVDATNQLLLQAISKKSEPA